MEYLLKHKNRNAALLEIEDSSIVDIHEVYAKEHLPVKHDANKAINIRLLDKWLENRGIPNSRENYDELLQTYKRKSLKDLTLLGYGLNLTDHWWLCKSGDNRKWEDVNFLQNTFSERAGALLFELQEDNFANPDFSSNGHLKKMWKIDNGKRMLYKAGSGDIRQEPYNECIASHIACDLGIHHITYSLNTIGDERFCTCECMIDENTEFIDAFKVYLYNTVENNNRYDDYIKTCKAHGINNAVEEIDKMILFDYLIRNTDRNTGNYGIFRDSETLQWIKIAPLFDHGDSLWNGIQNVNNISNDGKSRCGSFEGTNEKNLALVKNRGLYGSDKIADIADTVIDVFSGNERMEKERAERIAGCLYDRSKALDRK